VAKNRGKSVDFQGVKNLKIDGSEQKFEGSDRFWLYTIGKAKPDIKLIQ
jgi:hypothetical protein